MRIQKPACFLAIILGFILAPVVSKAECPVTVVAENPLCFHHLLTVSLTLKGNKVPCSDEFILARGRDRNDAIVVELFLSALGDLGIRFPQEGKTGECRYLPITDGITRHLDLVIDGNRLEFYRDTHLAGIVTDDWHIQGEITQWEVTPQTGNLSEGDIMIQDIQVMAAVIRPTDTEQRQHPIQVPAADLKWRGVRGLVFDCYQRPVTKREFPELPYRKIGIISDTNVHYAAQLGFDHIKILFTSDSFIQEDGMASPEALEYMEQKVNQVLDTGVCCLICMHPEPAYKQKYLGTWDGFETLLRLNEQLARFIDSHENWSPDRVAFQAMTEPFSNIGNWSIMTARQYQAIRRGAPQHTIFLSSNEAGNLDALKKMEPVVDDNVCYCFTTYEPYEFGFNLFMATQRPKEYWWRQVGPIPWPSSPERVAERMPELLADVPEENRAEAEQIFTTYGQGHYDRAWLFARAASLDKWANSFGGKLAVACVEFGCYLSGACPAPPRHGIKPEERIQFLRDLRESFDAFGFRWSYWSYNEVFTIYNPYVRKIHTTPKSEEEFRAWQDNALLEALGVTPLKKPAQVSNVE